MNPLDILNVRKWWHPQYGKYGGYWTRCASSEEYRKSGICPMPVDKLDEQFLKHDNASSDDVFTDVKLVGNLGKNLLDVVNPTAKYDKPVYGRLYHVGAFVTFIPISIFTVPIRGVKKLFRSKQKV